MRGLQERLWLNLLNFNVVGVGSLCGLQVSYGTSRQGGGGGTATRASLVCHRPGASDYITSTKSLLSLNYGLTGRPIMPKILSGIGRLPTL